jgi:hypothetical protein
LPDRARIGDHFNCRQAEDMSNRCPLLYEYIDLIYSQTPKRCVRDVRVLGNTMGDKTRLHGNDRLRASALAFVATKLHHD